MPTLLLLHVGAQIIGSVPPPSEEYLLLENTDFILLEDGSKIVLES